jgi:GxxExxY protein
MYIVHLEAAFRRLSISGLLEIEMTSMQMKFEREKELPIFYKNIQVGTLRVDFLVENKIMVELKATVELSNTNLAQAINYLEAFKVEIGLLINFGTPSLQFKRVHNDKMLQ